MPGLVQVSQQKKRHGVKEYKNICQEKAVGLA